MVTLQGDKWDYRVNSLRYLGIGYILLWISFKFSLSNSSGTLGLLKYCLKCDSNEIVVFCFSQMSKLFLSLIISIITLASHGLTEEKEESRELLSSMNEHTIPILQSVVSLVRFLENSRNSTKCLWHEFL